MADTEIEITADLVRDLLQEQHPDLAGLTIREVAGGWGNQMWRLGDGLAIRMQRNSISGVPSAIRTRPSVCTPSKVHARQYLTPILVH